ncbi:MAG: polysaccharide deacetylase family protein [Myxococcota bacterium]
MRVISLLSAAALLISCADAGEVDGHDHDVDMDVMQGLFTAAFEANEDPLKADGAGCKGSVIVDENFRRRIALTFDDGPHPTRTRAVMEILRAHNAPAAFFINGGDTQTETGGAILAEIVADPNFELANHSWSHEGTRRGDRFLDQKTDEELAAEIDDVTEVIEATGAEPRYFRFPFGRATCRTAAAVRERGYRVTGWNIDSADWCYGTGRGTCNWAQVPESLRSNMFEYTMRQARRNNGGIMLFHDIHQHTVDSLDEILTALEDEGFTFTTMDDLDTFPLLNGEMPEPPSFIGDACEVDEECDGSTRSFCHVAGFCTRPCEGPCPDEFLRAPTFCIEDPNVPATGICVSQSDEINNFCDDLPGTVEGNRDRFLGDSEAREAAADVCTPPFPDLSI